MDRDAAQDAQGIVIPFSTFRRRLLENGGSALPGSRRRRAGERPRVGDRRPVEELLASLKGRRGRLEDRLALLSLAIEKLEVQVETKRSLEILPGIS